MYKFFLSSLLIASILFCFAQKEPARRAAILSKYLAADKIFREAEKYTYKAPDDSLVQAKADRLYREALSQFIPLVREAKAAGYDSLQFFIRLRAGTIEYIFDSTGAAKIDFSSAIELKKRLPAIPDSFLFQPYLFTGGIYYSHDEFDSSLTYYKKAEEINDRYERPLNASERLYNRLGVMYYENGNYRQARNYFEQAIAVAPPESLNLITNYKMNIGALLVKLDELDRAKILYKSLLPLHVFDNEICHNLGIISLKQNQYQDAIGWLDKVNYTDKKLTELYYNRAMAWSGLKEPDSSGVYILKALSENQKWNGHKKNTVYGLILKFQADELARSKRYNDALPFYQQAIMQFDHHFSDADPGKNPEEFSAVYSYINLFNTLTAKAESFQKLYQQEAPQQLQTLINALNAYKAAFQLADHIGKTYNSDEARLFMAKIKYAVHSHPINIGIELYKLTGKKEYLEEVYFFDQRNKASVLTLDIQEQELRTKDPVTNELYRRESSLKSSITRLSMKAASGPDSAGLLELNATIRDEEIELNKVREEMAVDPVGQEWMAAERIPTVIELQRKLDNKTTILSYHLSEEKLLLLIISANRFSFHESGIGKDFFNRVTLLKNGLYNSMPGQRFSAAGDAVYLYRQLILPAASELSRSKRLIIIPDDELNYLPFEALQDENRNYLVQHFSIQYQFATSLLGHPHKRTPTGNILSFAPFVSSGFTDSNGVRLSRLPASGDETKDQPGILLTDSEATKEKFLDLANHYKVLHLATHATVNNEDHLRSYIAFFPGTPDYKLYAQEIYNIRLDSTGLVILSACETGSGQLVKGEGLMSLSRAFAYAGCPNIIASLWKAEDKTTAFIIRRLHYYLSRNKNKDAALQQAKIDMLNSNEIEPGLKTPDYWAHLVLIGNYEPDHKKSNWPWMVIFIIVILSVYIYFKKEKPAGTRAPAGLN